MDAMDAADVAGLAQQGGLEAVRRAPHPQGLDDGDPDAAQVADPGHVPGAGGFTVEVYGVGPGLVRIGGRERIYRLPLDAADLLVELARAEEEAGPGDGVVLAVTATSGGLGVTTLAAVLAATALMRGERCALVEADPLPGAAASMLAFEAGDGLRWADLAAGGPLVPPRLLDGLPRWLGAPVLCGDARGGPDPALLADAVRALRHECSLVVLDLPRHLLARRTLTALGVEACVLLTAPTPEALAGVAPALDALGPTPAQWVVRRAARPAVPEWYVADALGPGADGVLVLTQERGLADKLDGGEGPWGTRRGPLRVCAGRILGLLGQHHG